MCAKKSFLPIVILEITGIDDTFRYTIFPSALEQVYRDACDRIPRDIVERERKKSGDMHGGEKYCFVIT